MYFSLSDVLLFSGCWLSFIILSNRVFETGLDFSLLYLKLFSLGQLQLRRCGPKITRCALLPTCSSLLLRAVFVPRKTGHAYSIRLRCEKCRLGVYSDLLVRNRFKVRRMWKRWLTFFLIYVTCLSHLMLSLIITSSTVASRTAFNKICRMCN